MRTRPSAETVGVILSVIPLATGAAVVPVGLVATDECQPTDKKLPRLFRTVEVRFGRPIAAEHYAHHDERLALRQLTDELMFEIVQLCGRYEYQDTYATKKAEDVPVEVAQVPALPANVRVA